MDGATTKQLVLHIQLGKDRNLHLKWNSIFPRGSHGPRQSLLTLQCRTKKRKMDYIAIYEQAGNERDQNGGMHIPLFTCAQAFGEAYGRSVSFGLSKPFCVGTKSDADLVEEVFQYFLLVCGKEVAGEDCNRIYDEIVMGLAYGTISVFALSYKHQMFGGPRGERQRLADENMKRMAQDIVRHSRTAMTEKFCFWLDQILGQRQPFSERRWVDNGLLPYAVFDTIVFDYTRAERGAWLWSETLLASGRLNTSKRATYSRLVQRDRREGGPDSLMRAASAIACGVIDDERGNRDDKLSIVNWALETLDMSQIMKGNQVEHFTRLLYRREPWDKVRLSSVMFNLEILPGELDRPGGQRGWEHETQLLSKLIPSDARICCDGSWLSKGKTKVYATNLQDRYVYFQRVVRGARDSLFITAIVLNRENTASNRVLRYTAIAFDNLTNDDAARILRENRSRIEWVPVQRFLKRYGVTSVMQVCEFRGAWFRST